MLHRAEATLQPGNFRIGCTCYLKTRSRSAHMARQFYHRIALAIRPGYPRRTAADLNYKITKEGELPDPIATEARQLTIDYCVSICQR
jgi:hypothetical protein